MLKEKFAKKVKYRSGFYFSMFVILIVIQIVCLLAVSIHYNKSKEKDIEEAYHELDELYALQYRSYCEEGKAGIIFDSNENAYLALISEDGSIISNNDKSKLRVNGTNLFTYLNLGKIYDCNFKEACDAIVSGQAGSVVFYSGNLVKVLLYTPVGDGKHFIIRIVERDSITNRNDVYSSAFSAVMMLVILLELSMVVMLFMYKRYVDNIELSVARHDLIAADNDLISFTYHSSIACFEMTGAVDKIFGPEIGKRSQVDWNTLSSMLHPDDQMLIRNISKAIKDKEEKYTTEFRMKCQSGDYHWYRMNAKCISDGDDGVPKFVGTIQNSDDQITHENLLKSKAEHDLLTGLLNKMTIEEMVNRAVSKVSHNIFAFYIIDMDNFKAVNDNLGHAVGDKVLVDVASKLQVVFNGSDYVGRLGGDEFAVLLVIPAMMTSQAEKLIREKATVLNEILRADYGSESITISVSASIGIAVYPEDGTDFQTLYQHADKGLYYSKEHGKNQYTFFSETV